MDSNIEEIAAIDIEISIEDFEAASDIYDKLKAGTFYEEQEKLAKELGLTIKYI